MKDLKETLISIEEKVKMKNYKLANQINEMVNTLDSNPMIESFAKPVVRQVMNDDSGIVHSFAVEIKSNQDGPIPDTQLMSKILQAIESHNGTEDNIEQMSSLDSPKFEVVSFKYERRQDSKKQTK